MNPHQWKSALITGASSGLGREFAVQLAARGVSIVLVARNAERLAAVAQEVRAYGVPATPVVCDLENGADRERIPELLAAHNIDVVFNNAGYGQYGAFADIPLRELEGQIELNIAALVEVSWHAVRWFQQKGAGTLVNLSSVAAFSPVPRFSVYAATKSFVRDFSDALAFELRQTPIHIACVFPGPTATQFFTRAGGNVHSTIRLMSAKDCVSQTLHQLESGRTQIVPGFMNKTTVLLAKFLPRCVATFVSAYFMRNAQSS